MGAMDDELPIMTMIQAWAAVVWADGIVVKAEGRALRRLIAAARLNDADFATAMSWLDSEVNLPEFDVFGMSARARLGTYEAALKLAAADGNFVMQEGALLEDLRRGLGIALSDAAELESAILDGPLPRALGAT